MSSVYENVDPKVFFEILKVIYELPDDLFNDLLSALSRSSPVLSYRALLGKVMNELSDNKLNEISDIIKFLIVVYSNKSDSQESTIVSIADKFCQLLDDVDEDDFKISAEENHKFKERLIKLFSIESLSVRAKAIELVQEQTNVFLSARLVSDVRTVFKEKSTSEIAGACIIHTLKIGYVSNDEKEELYISMDDNHIKSLIKVLEQAKEKTESLKIRLQEAKVPYIGVE